MFHDDLSRRILGTFKVYFERWFLPRWVKFYKICLRFSFLMQTRWRGLSFFLSSLKTWFLHTRISLDPEGEGQKKMKRRGREGEGGMPIWDVINFAMERKGEEGEGLTLLLQGNWRDATTEVRDSPNLWLETVLAKRLLWFSWGSRGILSLPAIGGPCVI